MDIIETYIKYLEMKGYEREDRAYGIMSKDNVFFKIFHDKESYYLVMEKEAYADYVREQAKKRMLRLFNQFEFITDEELAYFDQFLINIASYMENEFGKGTYDPEDNNPVVDLAYTDYECDDSRGLYSVQISVDMIEKKLITEINSTNKGNIKYFHQYKSYKEMVGIIFLDFDSLVFVDDEDWERIG